MTGRHRASHVDPSPDPPQGAVPDLGWRGRDQGCDPGDRRDRRAAIGHRRELADGRRVRLLDRHARGMLGRPRRADRARPARPLVLDARGHRRARGDLDRQPVRDRGRRDRLLGPARPDRATPPSPSMLGASVEQIARGVESGLAVGLYPTIVELLKTIETHLAEGYRRVKIKIAPGPRRRARPRGPAALRRHRR